MSEPETCADCRFTHRQSEPYDKYLECRRRAPTINKHGRKERVDWPFVTPDDWCGEFSRRPKK